jgi:type III secretion protein L
VSQKFFSLIHHHQDSVHTAPNTKVIKADAFSTLLETEKLLEKVKKDAEDYQVAVTSECEKLKEQSQKEGFEEGFTKWAEHIVRLEQEILAVRKDMEKLIIPVALKAAKKIVGKEIELSENVIVDIVASNLKAVAQHKKVTIYVNKNDFETLEKNRQKIKDLFESLETLSIRERADIEEGGCVIETEGGIINARLENRWRILLKDKGSSH